jgi:hypothetical protein
MLIVRFIIIFCKIFSNALANSPRYVFFIYLAMKKKIPRVTDKIGAPLPFYTL